MIWQVLAYPAPAAGTVIDEWKVGRPDEAVTKFEQRIRFLRDREKRDWKYEWAHNYKDSDGLFEILFDVKRIAYRVFCCMGPLNHHFIILAFAVEHNWKLKPEGIIGTAERRKQESLSGKVRLTHYDPNQ